MTWRDKDEFGDPALFGSGRRGGNSWFRRVFFRGDDPMRWGIPLFRLRGILVQVGWLFIIFAGLELITGSLKGGFVPAALAMGSLFVLVLLHEFGHCFACRWVEGEADEILMWPLGGLAFCRPPHNWKAEFITVAGGPGVNLVLVPILGVVTQLVWDGHARLIFNPFQPGLVVNEFATAASLTGQSNLQLYSKMYVWWLYYTNLVLLAFNVLLPMFPMDGGRLLQTLLWRSMGYRRSMSIAVNVGLVAAVVLAMIGISSDSGRTIGIAIFGGLTCWNERRRLTATDEIAAESYGAHLGQGAEEAEEDSPSQRKADKAAEQALREQEEVDRILAKIKSSGMGSLSRKERRTLQGATKRRRGT